MNIEDLWPVGGLEEYILIEPAPFPQHPTIDDILQELHSQTSLAGLNAAAEYTLKTQREVAYVVEFEPELGLNYPSTIGIGTKDKVNHSGSVSREEYENLFKEETGLNPSQDTQFKFEQWLEKNEYKTTLPYPVSDEYRSKRHEETSLDLSERLFPPVIYTVHTHPRIEDEEVRNTAFSVPDQHSALKDRIYTGSEHPQLDVILSPSKGGRHEVTIYRLRDPNAYIDYEEASRAAAWMTQDDYQKEYPQSDMRHHLLDNYDVYMGTVTKDKLEIKRVN